MESTLFSLNYYKNVHQRTDRVVQLIPEEYLEWSPAHKLFSLGDLVRHIAAIERYLFVEIILHGKSCYSGCSKELAPDLKRTLEFYRKCHDESVLIVSSLTEEALRCNCTSPSGVVLPVWKWLRAMLEHEIHHRGQLYTYLSMLSVCAPPIFGLSSEQVIELSKK